MIPAAVPTPPIRKAAGVVTLGEVYLCVRPRQGSLHPHILRSAAERSAPKKVSHPSATARARGKKRRAGRLAMGQCSAPSERPTPTCRCRSRPSLLSTGGARQHPPGWSCVVVCGRRGRLHLGGERPLTSCLRISLGGISVDPPFLPVCHWRGGPMGWLPMSPGSSASAIGVGRALRSSSNNKCRSSMSLVISCSSSRLFFFAVLDMTHHRRGARNLGGLRLADSPIRSPTNTKSPTRDRAAENCSTVVRNKCVGSPGSAGLVFIAALFFRGSLLWRGSP